jgi:signal transduction histidine kinase
MAILPIEFVLLVGTAFAVFGLGFLAWLRHKWSRGTALFALLCFSFSLWLSAGWFRILEPSALPLQVIMWRLLFYLSLSLAPAMALHIATALGRRPLRRTGWLAYGLGVLLFVLLDTGFLLQSFSGQAETSRWVLGIGAVSMLLIYIIVFLSIAAFFHPSLHDRRTSFIERRRAGYVVLFLAAYLGAGAMQFLDLPFPSDTAMLALGLLFFVISSAALIRTNILRSDMSFVDALFLVLLSSAGVTILRARNSSEVLYAILGTVGVCLFGVSAIRAIHHSTRRRRDMERLYTDLRSLDAARREVAATVAHQLRGPLSGIRSAAALFIEGDYGALSDAGKQTMEQIRNSAERLLALAETSLNAARLEAHALRSTPSNVDVAAELRGVVGTLELSARAKGIGLLDVRFGALPSSLRLDREALRNAVFNLLDNAIKYTDHGHVSLEARAENQKLIIIVSDTGAGFSSDDAGRLFQKFVRGEEGKRMCADGAGLGLYVSKHLIEDMGGTIQAESEGPGKGSVFRMEIPFKG